MATKAQKIEQTESVSRLRQLLKRGDTVWCVLRHVSASGMSRRIDFYVIRKNQPLFLTGLICSVLSMRHHRSGGAVVGGCGMDMGFHVVNSLSYALHGYGVQPKSHRAGYTLRCEWL